MTAWSVIQREDGKEGTGKAGTGKAGRRDRWRGMRRVATLNCVIGELYVEFKEYNNFIAIQNG